MRKYICYAVDKDAQDSMFHEATNLTSSYPTREGAFMTKVTKGTFNWGGQTHDNLLLNSVKHFQEEILKPATSNQITHKWLDVQKQHEYKPVNNYVDKGNHLFIIVFLKLPEHIKLPETDTDYVDKTGGVDLILPQRQQYIPPRPGTMIIMRSNIFQTTYAFKGEGERWTMNALVKCEGWEDYE